MFARSEALQKTRTLMEQRPLVLEEPEEADECAAAPGRETFLRRYLALTGCEVNPLLFIVASAAAGCFAAAAAGAAFSLYFTPLFFLGGALLPWAWCERKINSRAAAFSDDYPAVLLATASSIKAGMTVCGGLERAVRLLPPGSIVAVEVKELLSALNRGIPREQAASAFGRGIRQPDIELFRTAFLLVMENGGRFAPTLERLARVCRDRAILIRQARVATATMRMTANVLLFVTPVVVAIVAARQQNFWDVFLHNPTANLLSTAGIAIIGCSFAVLLRMSSFKP